MHLIMILLLLGGVCTITTAIAFSPSCHIFYPQNPSIKAHLHLPNPTLSPSKLILLMDQYTPFSAMAALCFKTLLVSLLLIMPFSYGMVDGFQDGMQAKYSLEKSTGMIQMNSSRKLLALGAMLDYDDAGANTKHEYPRRKPGKP